MCNQECLLCNSTGKVECEACRGKGKVGGFLGLGARLCALCEGNGSTTCADCNGSGHIQPTGSVPTSWADIQKITRSFPKPDIEALMGGLDTSAPAIVLKDRIGSLDENHRHALIFGLVYLLFRGTSAQRKQAVEYIELWPEQGGFGEGRFSFRHEIVEGCLAPSQAILATLGVLERAKGWGFTPSQLLGVGPNNPFNSTIGIAIFSEIDSCSL